MKFHPYSEVFPLLDDSRLAELSEDVKAFGLRERIWLYKGQILDGRNRFLACQKVKIKPEYRTYKGTDQGALALVISANIQRRHLSDAQRAFAAARIATLGKGGDSNAPRGALTQSEAAEQLQVGRRSVQRVRQIIDKGSKALQQAAESGEIPLKKAASVIDLPKSEQLAAATAPPEFVLQDYNEAEDGEAIARAEQELAKAFDTIVASDDRFAAFQSEIKRLTQQLAVTERSRDHYQNQAGEAVRQLKAERRKVSSLENKLKKLRGEPVTPPGPIVQ